MIRADLWDILDLMPRFDRAAAKIHVFEPYWMKVLVEAAHMFPYVAAQHEKGPRGLLHRAGAIQIPVQISITAVHRVARPQAVDSQKLEGQSCSRRKAADAETGLRAAIGPGKLTRGESVFPARLDQWG
jgi:hypothetical protein